MMLLAGASLAVVPVLSAPGLLRAAALGAEPIAGAATAPCPTACPAAFAAAPDELATLFELPAEHPARNMPPPSRTLPIMRPAMAPCLVVVPLSVFRMPL